jgi:iron complex outermembrane receptor protein
VKGIEIEMDARPVDAVHIYGSLGLLRAHFLSYMDRSTVDGDLHQVADNRYFPKAPRTTAAGGIDLQVYDGDVHGKVTLSGDVQYQSKTFSLPGQFVLDPLYPLVAVGDDQHIPSQFFVNGRIRWDDIALGSSGLKGYAMLWAKNLTNDRKVNNKISFGPNFGGLTDSNYLDPRTYGVTLGFKY